MTKKQYVIYRAKGTKIYDIKIAKNKFMMKEVPFERFDNNWVARMWLNESVVCDSEKFILHIYTTEDKIEECKKKLYEYAKTEYEERLEKAKKEMEDIEELGKELFREEGD